MAEKMDARTDLEALCREQLDSFRIKELRDVLARLGLPKQGKKQVLRDKIMAVFMHGERQTGSRGRTVDKEETARVIADIYRKRQGPAAPDLATEEAKTRCPCGNANDAGVMIQCDDSKCGTWQHMNCVVVPEKVEEGVVPVTEVPTQFYCELCRIARGDPFCSSLGNPLLPTKFTGSKSEGQPLAVNVDKVFKISRAERELIQKPGHDLQVWCVLLNDKVSFRMHWPLLADLRMNGLLVRVANRPGHQLLGVNGRDEGPGVASLVREGDNRLCLWSSDARQFCVGVRIIRRLSVSQVMEQIPDVSVGEAFEEALARVRRAVNGSAGAGDDEDEDDDDRAIVSEMITVNLRCPMSGSRISMAGRFKPCTHMGCFDLETFVELNQRARKWQCPICLKNFCLEQLIVDPFINRIVSAMKGYGEDVTEVEMQADGVWRPKLEGDARLRESWRTPEGSLVLSNGVSKNSSIIQPVLKPVKVEEGLSSHDGASLKLGMKRNRDGQWIMNGAKRFNGVTSHNVAGPSQPQKPTVITRSSSATDSNDEGVNGDERSVNQEPSDLEGPGENIRSKAGKSSGIWESGRLAANDISAATDVILLSDSDDEADDLIVTSSGGPVHILSGHNNRADVVHKAPSPELLSDDIPGETEMLQAGTTELGLTPVSILQPFSSGNPVPSVGASTLGSSAGGFLPLDKGNNFWSNQQTSIPFGLFGPGSDTVPSTGNHLMQPLRPTPVQAVEGASYGLSAQPNSNVRVGDRWGGFARPISGAPSYSDCSGFISDNPGRSSPTESALHIFLPHQPARAVETTLREPVLPDDEINNSWFSLSLGGDIPLDPALAPSTVSVPAIDSFGPALQGRSQRDSLTNTANVLLGITSNGSQTSLEPLSSRRRISILHTQRRSSSNTARHRRYYRIDSDSE